MDNTSQESLDPPRYLHPLSLFFEIARMVRGNLIPTIAALVSARSGGWIGLNIGFGIFGIGLAIAIVRYFTFRYQIAGGELIIHQGIFDRLHRTVPVSRIQNIDLSQNIFHRLLRVGEVRVETASGKKPEAVMRVVAFTEFVRLKDELSGNRQKSAAEQVLPVKDKPEIKTIAESPRLILELPTRLIALAGLLSNRGEVIAGIAIGLLWQYKVADKWFPSIRFGEVEYGDNRETARAMVADSDSVKGLFQAVRDDYGLLGSMAFLALGLITLFALLRVFSALWYIFKFYGYRLELQDDSLHVKCGLLTQVSATIPRGRVQLISVQRSWLARRCGLASIRIETAGGGDGKSQDAATSVGRKWFVPVIDARDVPRILAAIDQRIEYDDSTILWQPLSKHTAKRMFRPILIASVLLFSLGLFVLPYWGWLSGVIVGVLGWLYVQKKSKSRRYARTEWGAIYRSGTWLQKCSMTFFEKIQSAAFHQTPFDRRWAMATIAFDTASAGPSDHRMRITCLDSEFASSEFARLQRDIHRAARR
jgi:putative membrane protein